LFRFWVITLTGFSNKEFLKEFVQELRKDKDIWISPTIEMFPEEHIDEINTHLKDFVNLFIRKNYGVSCFSTDPRHILMWSHYADSHKGICIAFDKDILVDSLKEYNENVKMSKIDYVNNVPVIDINIIDNKITLSDEIEKVITSKLKHWDYEKEVRIYSLIEEFKNSRIFKFDKKAIKGVIFGSKCPIEDTCMIVKLLTNMKNSRYMDNRWGLCKTDLANQEMKINLTSLIGNYNDCDLPNSSS
jgi:hypothetical protein